MTNLPPLIRLEVEGMKYSVMHYLSEHHQDIEREVECQLEQAIASYDFPAEVRKHIHACIDSAIAGYFKYGKGHDAVRDAVWAALDTQLDQ